MTASTSAVGPEDDLAFIRRVMEGARETVADHSGHLILWGLLPATAYVLTYLAGQGALQVSINAVWAVVVGIGFSGSWLLTRRTEKRAPVNSLVDRILAAIWIACGLSLSLVGFLGVGTGSLPSFLMPGINSVLIGSAFFASAVLPDRTAYRALAASWWMLGGWLIVRPTPEASLVVASAHLLLMLVPGLVLRARRPSPLGLHVVA